jgi:undecaprenyl-diphosphatase
MPKPFETALSRLRAPDLEIVIAALAVMALLFSFVQLGGAVSAGGISIDDRILLAMREPGDPARGLGGDVLAGMVRDLTALGSGTVTGLFAFAFVGYLLMVGRPRAALFVVVAVLGAWALNTALKELFARERPTVVTHLITANEPSFPSGHTMIATTFYPTMAELLGRLGPQRRVRLYLMAIAIVLALLIGLSRIYLGVHYPSDVLGGLCAGLGWALFCGIVARVLQGRRVVEPPSAGAPEAA